MQYQIMQHDGGRKLIPAIINGAELIYNCPKEAALAAKALTAQRGIKFQPRPIKTKAALLWQEREKGRFTNGEYTPVLWIKESWWKEINGHFAHVGVKDKTRIAFTPDAEKGAADRQTAMLPGKYLQQFFADVLTTEQIRDYAMQHSTRYEDNELKWARTPEEIQEVYKHYISSSCFSGTTNANLYGSGDFAVAYISDANGKVTARAICALKSKAYPQIYGDGYRLGALLQEAGFERSTKHDKYTGLKLVKKWHWRGWYCDWSGNGHPLECKDNPEFLITK